MSDLPERLKAVGIRRALIVDDVYDAIPLAADLEIDADEWTNFFDDLEDPDRELLREIAPEFDALSADQLRISATFVANLWCARGRFRPELINPVFARYDNDMEHDREHVDEFRSQLEALGLIVTTAGRNFVDAAARVDLIVIDLFLGSPQNEQAINCSKEGLKAVVDERRVRPPLIVLMSRSHRLADKREEYRDQVGLQASTFRITAKADIAGGKLVRLLSGLTDHYKDSTKLAAFLHAWDESVKAAVGRTLGLMRTLELSDYAQIQQLLLSAEGEPTGSYVVDIFDRVLQHEIESERALIESAIALNGITADCYPPPYIEGSQDLQQLVYRSLFQHHERLRLTGTACRVAFGDLLRPSRPEGKLACSLDDIDRGNLLAVMTPACDLQRGGAKRVMLLVGTIKLLTSRDWSYTDVPVRTPVIELDSERYWIKWNLKHVDTIAPKALADAVASRGLEVVARLRESHALELQQKLLANMGRIGLPAPMPATFPIEVQVCYAEADAVPVPLPIDALKVDSTCYVGRPGVNAMCLVLANDACEEIAKAIAELDVIQVHDRAKNALRYLQEQPDELTMMLNKGLTLPSPDAVDFKPILSSSEVMDDHRVKEIGVIARNRKDGLTLRSGDLVKAGIIVLVKDPLPQVAAPAEPFAVQEGPTVA